MPRLKKARPVRRPSRHTFGAPQDERKDAFTPELAQGFSEAGTSVGWIAKIGAEYEKAV